MAQSRQIQTTSGYSRTVWAYLSHSGYIQAIQCLSRSVRVYFAQSEHIRAILSHFELVRAYPDKFEPFRIISGYSGHILTIPDQFPSSSNRAYSGQSGPVRSISSISGPFLVYLGHSGTNQTIPGLSYFDHFGSILSGLFHTCRAIPYKVARVRVYPCNSVSCLSGTFGAYSGHSRSY